MQNQETLGIMGLSKFLIKQPTMSSANVSKLLGTDTTLLHKSSFYETKPLVLALYSNLKLQFESMLHW